ncbi:MAG: glycosyltransferase family 2 protein [Clostridia bacterium]|nr:glycosyltransferase family 2 protein [Clostridia bacterium]
MTVSVIVATYRRDNSLKAALESLAKQSYTDFEIVLVDDNGCEEWNERVSKIAAAFLGSFPDIPLRLIVNNPNQGSARARNIGIAEAKGEFVTFLDDDDIYLPEKLKNQLEYMLESGTDYSITDLELFNEADKLIDRRVRSYIKAYDSTSLLKYHFMYHITGTDTMMFKKEYLNKIGGFDAIDVGDEFYLMKKAIEGGGKFGYLNCCDVKAYVHTGEAGLSGGQGKIDGENRLYEFKKRYFSKIDRKTVKYIKMRHYAVLAFANIKMKKPIQIFKNGILSFSAQPIECCKLLITRKI